MTEHTERLERLEQALQTQVQTWRRRLVVDALQALRGVPCTVAVPPRSRTRGPHPLRDPQTAHAFPGLNPSSILHGRAAPSGGPHPGWEHSGPPGTDQRRLGLSLTGQSQAASPTAPGESAQAHPGPESASLGPPGPTLAATDRPRDKRRAGRGRHGLGTQGGYGGDCPGGPTAPRDRNHCRPLIH